MLETALSTWMPWNINWDEMCSWNSINKRYDVSFSSYFVSSLTESSSKPRQYSVASTSLFLRLIKPWISVYRDYSDIISLSMCICLSASVPVYLFLYFSQHSTSLTDESLIYQTVYSRKITTYLFNNFTLSTHCMPGIIFST